MNSKVSKHAVARSHTAEMYEKQVHCLLKPVSFHLISHLQLFNWKSCQSVQLSVSPASSGVPAWCSFAFPFSACVLIPPESSTCFVELDFLF